MMPQTVEAPRQLVRAYSWIDMPSRRRDPREVLRVSSSCAAVAAASKGTSGGSFSGNFATLFPSTVLALQGDFGVTVSSGVVQWADRSGGAHHAVPQGGAGNPATTAGLNSKPGILINTASALVTNLILPAPGTTPVFIWAAFRQLTTWVGTSPILIDPGNTFYQLRQAGASPGIRMNDNGTGPLCSDLTFGSFGLVEIAMNNDPANDYIRAGTGSAQIGTSGNSAGSTGLSLGFSPNSSVIEWLALVVCTALPSGALKAAARATAQSWWGGAFLA